jgi:hypothetical protein
VVATDEPTEEDKRRRAERDDAFVWGQQLRCGRLRVLDLATGELRTLDGLGHRHVVELAARPDGGALAAISWAGPEQDAGIWPTWPGQSRLAATPSTMSPSPRLPLCIVT